VAELRQFKNHLKSVSVIISVALIAVFHYSTELSLHSYHILYQGLFFIPVMLAGFWFGLRGGLLCSLSITLIYLPFLYLTWSNLSAIDANNLMEIILYNAVAVILGMMKDREHARQNRIVESEKQLRHLSQKLLNAQESERKMVAQELHDSICGTRSPVGPRSLCHHTGLLSFSPLFPGIKTPGT
jgi:glucose-6-phosphate-specific signal transduction histidine kinase